jgi:hypothetical protein
MLSDSDDASIPYDSVSYHFLLSSHPHCISCIISLIEQINYAFRMFTAHFQLRRLSMRCFSAWQAYLYASPRDLLRLPLAI